MSHLSDISVVLPSLDPDEKLTAVIDGLLQYGFTDIILINDGSKPENLHYFEEAAQHPEVTLLHHEVNRGKGAALKTAFTWFLNNRPDDTKACSEHMMETGRLVLGVRDFDQPDVPFKSRNGNKITSAVFKIFVGMIISDTQTGLRAIPRKDLEILNTVSGDRFEYETNMLLAMKTRGIPFDEVKIRTVYIEENKSSHFRAFRDSWRIYKLILAHFFKYTISSLASAVVDEGLFILLTYLMQSTLSGFALTAVPMAIARVISSVMNFYVNKKLVFDAHVSTGKAFLKYFALAVPQAIAQLGLTYCIYELFHISESATFLRGLIYALVMTALFFASFVIQQRWVFAEKKEKQSV